MLPLTSNFFSKCSKCVTGPRIPCRFATNTNEFKTVYKFPYIRGIGLINRLKFYQTALSAIALPGATILNQLNLISYDEVLFTCIVGLAGLVPLYGFGHFANKLVGIVYLNEQSKLVKIAYLDFWGNRKDTVIPLQEIVPLSEAPAALTDPLYLKVRQFSAKNMFKLCSKYGVVDENGFNKVFASYLETFT